MVFCCLYSFSWRIAKFQWRLVRWNDCGIGFWRDRWYGFSILHILQAYLQDIPDNETDRLVDWTSKLRSICPPTSVETVFFIKSRHNRWVAGRFLWGAVSFSTWSCLSTFWCCHRPYSHFSSVSKRALNRISEVNARFYSEFSPILRFFSTQITCIIPIILNLTH